jgi:hypothetical protein
MAYSHYFNYKFDRGVPPCDSAPKKDGLLCADSYTITATGDPDCDGKVVTYTTRGFGYATNAEFTIDCQTLIQEISRNGKPFNYDDLGKARLKSSDPRCDAFCNKFTECKIIPELDTCRMGCNKMKADAVDQFEKLMKSVEPLLAKPCGELSQEDLIKAEKESLGDFAPFCEKTCKKFVECKLVEEPDKCIQDCLRDAADKPKVFSEEMKKLLPLLDKSCDDMMKGMM